MLNSEFSAVFLFRCWEILWAASIAEEQCSADARLNLVQNDEGRVNERGGITLS